MCSPLACQLLSSNAKRIAPLRMADQCTIRLATYLLEVLLGIFVAFIQLDGDSDELHVGARHPEVM